MSPQAKGSNECAPIIMQGDCCDLMAEMPSDIIDLIVTSPPYADQRASTYGGTDPNHYIDWFVPIADEMQRVLKPTGSLILNIKEHAVSGERHPYVIELIREMQHSGWLWTEEYIWHKKNSYPGKWPNRFRDAWERCLHFTKQRQFAMYQDAVRVPRGEWAVSRLKNLSTADRSRQTSKGGSGFGRKAENWVGTTLVYPTNVLHLATECQNRSHPAAFPQALPEWFIRLFTVEHALVLDPFAGSGTTVSVAHRLNRRALGIELIPEYATLAGVAPIMSQTVKGLSASRRLPQTIARDFQLEL